MGSLRDKSPAQVIALLKGYFGVTRDKELADKLDLSQQTISSWRIRNRVPSVHLLRFEEVLNAQPARNGQKGRSAADVRTSSQITYRSRAIGAAVDLLISTDPFDSIARDVVSDVISEAIEGAYWQGYGDAQEDAASLEADDA